MAGDGGTFWVEGLLCLHLGKKTNEKLKKNINQYQWFCAWQLWSEGKGVEFVDEAMGGSYVALEAIRCIHVGLLCVQDHTTDRPSMADENITIGRPLMLDRHTNKLDSISTIYSQHKHNPPFLLPMRLSASSALKMNQRTWHHQEPKKLDSENSQTFLSSCSLRDLLCQLPKVCQIFFSIEMVTIANHYDCFCCSSLPVSRSYIFVLPQLAFRILPRRCSLLMEKRRGDDCLQQAVRLQQRL
ncbi:hypothetical protein G4B88_024338 [Cannabis sativa]|uniref:Uncharacterized protein n=1 Tax=Cannabis sativa TaxID=3483 RepID=A0A7J6H4Y2_CANSA|nr:hypothetical protein G4B88_024338 [Cannabis sativa]